MNKKRILSGAQPSGLLHIGNYFGMIERMIDFQDSSDLFCFIANYHSLTSISNKQELEKNTFNAFSDLLSLGLDSKKSTVWVQSHVPAVTELTWILSNFTSVGLMQRSTSYKDKVANGLSPNMGLFSYPILMASDILAFQSDIVPVGKDQKQHLEMTRDIAIKFNNAHGPVFTIPEIDIDESSEIIGGIDGRKMSKSYNNTIPIFGSEDYMKNQIMNIVTDSAGLNEPKDINTPLFNMYALFLNDDEKNELKDRYATPGLKYMSVKNELYQHIMDYFSKQRTLKQYYIDNPDNIFDLMEVGKKKAEVIASDTLSSVKKSIGMV
ncbi:MAG: tryptophan--tRNA ligase [Candidatus Marinimicrobia bacterium]|jgi:tryptophanyl-tRNA synthetase|nr:tryptophan--tRNA ligase [Gammaproteobacteria bacterium]MBL6911582.1 tryptophan--tRNA ligase [Candidatus Neomarinimicrobiota bacterium]MBT3727680.1 tryptophan--tRNA ligase [Candidatus Neomarinimicrobiota bacterium]MBT3944695.1 tryptophan--tRNA ligase [Candidatus Neomarinimicrobiota bacterium]MBT4111838.1 tryptophan--tRNA ligase [Candidatus Neomarinimicrobiota bacterium]